MEHRSARFFSRSMFNFWPLDSGDDGSFMSVIGFWAVGGRRANDAVISWPTPEVTIVEQRNVHQRLAVLSIAVQRPAGRSGAFYSLPGAQQCWTGKKLLIPTFVRLPMGQWRLKGGSFGFLWWPKGLKAPNWNRSGRKEKWSCDSSLT